MLKSKLIPFSLLRSTRLCHSDQQLLLPCQTGLLHQAPGSGEGAQAATQTGRSPPQDHHEHQLESCEGSTPLVRERSLEKSGNVVIVLCSDSDSKDQRQVHILHPGSSLIHPSLNLPLVFPPYPSE